MVTLRSSLAAHVAPERAPSEAEVMRRRRELEPKLYRKHGAIILHRDDPDLIGLDRILFDRIAKMRFG